MKLKVLGSSSAGNSYIFESDNSALIVEAGYPLKEVLKAINFDREKIQGCLVSHEHGDHSKYIKDYLNNGIKCLTPPYYSQLLNNMNAYTVEEQTSIKVGDNRGFVCTPLEMIHDVECYGYTIYHPEMGSVLFITDTEYVPHDLGFFKFSHIMIEANYGEDIIRKKMQTDATMIPHLRHIMKGHLSIENCISYLTKMDLSECNDIILLHLSDNNSNEKDFIKRVRSAFPLVNVLAAHSGLVINDFNKERF